MKKLPYIIAAIAVIAAIYAWFKPLPPPQKEYVRVEVPRDIIKIKRVEVPIEKIVVIEKEKLITKRELPDWLKKDDNIQVMSIGLVQPYKGKTEVLSTINIKTGESELLQRQLRLSFFQFLNEKEIGIRYGTDFTGFAKYTFLRTGNLYFSGHVQLGKTNTVQVELSYRW